MGLFQSFFVQVVSSYLQASHTSKVTYEWPGHSFVYLLTL